MITVSNFVQALKLMMPSVTFYNGAIDKNNKTCIGVYARGSSIPYKAVGDSSNTSFSTLPISILIHWSENADTCETMANTLYEKLSLADDLIVGGKRVIMVKMLESTPVNVDRDANNICEMVIRLHLIYER